MWKRNKISLSDNSKNITFNKNLGLRHQIMREPSVVDEFYFENCQPSDDSLESVSVVDPIIILLNQERIDNMGTTAAKTFLDSLSPKSNALSELRSKVSDDDLMSMIKSRHLQSPSEILAWCRYIKENVDAFNSEIAKIKAEQIAQEEEAVKQNSTISDELVTTD